MRFTDGVSFDTSGEMRIESRHDGLYVVGGGMLCAVNSHGEGNALIESMKASKEKREEPRVRLEFAAKLDALRAQGVGITGAMVGLTQEGADRVRP
jgi:hypothetical protein